MPSTEHRRPPTRARPMKNLQAPQGARPRRPDLCQALKRHSLNRSWLYSTCCDAVCSELDVQMDPMLRQVLDRVPGALGLLPATPTPQARLKDWIKDRIKDRVEQTSKGMAQILWSTINRSFLRSGLFYQASACPCLPSFGGPRQRQDQPAAAPVPVAVVPVRRFTWLRQRTAMQMLFRTLCFPCASRGQRLYD